MNTLFLQGLVFSGLTIGILAFFAWWLYLSPVKQAVGTGQSDSAQGKSHIATSARLSSLLAILVCIGAVLISFGAYWDLSEHLVTGPCRAERTFCGRRTNDIRRLFAYISRSVADCYRLRFPTSNLESTILAGGQGHPYVGGLVLVADTVFSPFRRRHLARTLRD